MRTLFTLLIGSGLCLAATERPANVAGVYEGAVPVKNSDARKVTLVLQQDGVSEFRDGAKKEAGHWSVTGEELQLELVGRSAPMLWKIGKSKLILEDGNRAEYGNKGLTLRRPR